MESDFFFLSKTDVHPHLTSSSFLLSPFDLKGQDLALFLPDCTDVCTIQFFSSVKEFCCASEASKVLPSIL